MHFFRLFVKELSKKCSKLRSDRPPLPTCTAPLRLVMPLPPSLRTTQLTENTIVRSHLLFYFHKYGDKEIFHNMDGYRNKIHYMTISFILRTRLTYSN